MATHLSFLTDTQNIGEYWNENTVLFPAQRESVVDLPAKDDLLLALNGHFKESKWVAGIPVNINASKVIDAQTNQQFQSIDHKNCSELFNNGFTLCFGDLSDEISSVSELKKAACGIFGHPDLIFVTAYLSPPHSVGPLHYDRQHNFFLQKEGQKKWHISQVAAIRNPFENLVYNNVGKGFFEEMRELGYSIKSPTECGRDTLILNEGDVLYLPPGFYHSPETLDDPSLHFTLTVEPANFWQENNKNLFSLMLRESEIFNQDQRFLSTEEKKEIFTKCRQLIKQDCLD